jgi:hypothetical protein
MIYSAESKPDDTPIDYIPKASQAAVIVQCTGVWFAGGKFGVTWKLIQAVIKQKPTLKGKCYIQLPKPEADEYSLTTNDNSQVSETCTVLPDPPQDTTSATDNSESQSVTSTLPPASAKKTILKRK